MTAQYYPIPPYNISSMALRTFLAFKICLFIPILVMSCHLFSHSLDIRGRSDTEVQDVGEWQCSKN